MREPFTAQLFVSEFVLARERMLSAVGFDDEPCLQAGEVDDVGRDRMLPAKTPPEPAETQLVPEHPLGLGGIPP